MTEQEKKLADALMEYQRLIDYFLRETNLTTFAAQPTRKNGKHMATGIKSMLKHKRL